MEYKCYLCKNILSIASSIDMHFICNNCPDTNINIGNELWSQPYSIYVDNGIIINRFVFIASIQKWVEIWSNKKISKITSSNGATICKMDYIVDIDQFEPHQLEKKIKTWILLQ